MKRALGVVASLCLGVLAGCSDAVSPNEASRPSPARAQTQADYIVVLNDNVVSASGMALQLVQAHGGTVRFNYEHAIKGFAARLPAAAVAALARNPNVAFIEPDQVFTISTTQAAAPWGLDRIDEHSFPLTTTFNYTNTGSGVRAYIIDTGIRFSHTQFGTRATSGFDAVDGGSADDCNGHGTHVAGTVGGSKYGVAKAVKLIAVRVLNCGGSGSTAGVIAGVDWVTANRIKPAVANMSLGGGPSTALDNAVKNSIAAGVTYGIAAGNGNIFGVAQNACNFSPARVPEAITVSATNNTDNKASWANFGTCVDLFAPGVGITSAWHTSNTAINTISGTSMATPHVVGVAAQYLQTHATSTPSQVRSALVTNSTPGKVINPGAGSPNRLLYTNY